jgi:hypothetical protein
MIRGRSKKLSVDIQCPLGKEDRNADDTYASSLVEPHWMRDGHFAVAYGGIRGDTAPDNREH